MKSSGLKTMTPLASQPAITLKVGVQYPTFPVTASVVVRLILVMKGASKGFSMAAVGIRLI
jgi:hypothetical protein